MMRKYIQLILIIFISSNNVASDHKAFDMMPMGYGSRNIGGQGSQIIYVNNLNDDGPGSLREALTKDSSRIIEFMVEGIIELHSSIIITTGDVTINGPKSSGIGITLLNYGLQFYGSCSNIIIRDIRIKGGKGGTTTSGDCLSFHASGDNEITNVLIDHCSLMWGTDEILDTWGNVSDLTCQWTIIAEAEDQFNPRNGANGRGWLSGINCNRITIHHCLFAHNGDRNPSFSGGGHYEFINNVIYNWFYNNATKISEGASVDIINNNYIPGPQSSSISGYIFPNHPEKNTGIYLSGNIFSSSNNVSQWDNVTWYNKLVVYKPAPKSFKRTKRIGDSGIIIGKTENLFETIIKNVGARSLDSDDQRIINEVINRNGHVGKGIFISD